MATTLASQVQELYVGYLGRAADKAGLDFWVKAIENGTSTLESVALGFTLSEEYKAQYNGLTTTQLVAKVYQNVLGRAADADGLAFWAGEVNKGVIKADTLVKSMINSLGAIDQLTIDNKVTAANAYTIAAGANYNVEAGKAAVLNAGATLPGANNPGQTFTLSTATGEKVVGTAGNDEVRAVVGSAEANSTLNIGDTIDGGAGKDTLNLTFAGTYAAAAGVEIKNVEVVNLNVTSAKADESFLKSSLYTGVQELWQVATGSEVVSAAVTAGSAAAAQSAVQAAEQYKNVVVADGVTAGFKGNGTTTADAVRFAAGFSTASGTDAAIATATATSWNALEVKAASATQKTISIALDGVGTGSSLKAVAEGSGKIETVNVSGSIAKASSTTDGSLTVDVTANAKAFNGAFTSGVNLTLSNTTIVETVDLSKSTGGVELNASTYAKLATLKGGAGNDKLTINLVDVALTVDAGAGNDVITISDAASSTDTKGATITLGAGKDTLKVSALLNVVDTADLSKGLVTVTDFKIGEDTLQLGSTVGKVLTAAQLDSAKTAGTLKAAVETLLTGDNAVVANKAAVFSWGGDAYVFVNDSDAGFGAGDGLIKLTGVDASLLSTDQNGGLLFA